MSDYKHTKQAEYSKKIKALCALNDQLISISLEKLSDVVKSSPDSETAFRSVMTKINPDSTQLQGKWRDIIGDLWADSNTTKHHLPQLPLAYADVIDTPILQDAYALLRALKQNPAPISYTHDDRLIKDHTAYKLAQALPSYMHQKIWRGESEWSYVNLRRLRSILQSLGLVRIHAGKIVVVSTRYSIWLKLPAVMQYYCLWHADVHHNAWQPFASLWGEHLSLIQNNLSILFTGIAETTADFGQERADFAINILGCFMPLWEGEGLINVPFNHISALPAVTQHALPTIIDRFILRDLFARHGLIKMSDQFGHISKFQWTNIGPTLIQAEARGILPCHKEIIE